MRYIIGIDLGTTNTCMSYVDTHQSAMPIQMFSIPQIFGEGCVKEHKTLPSCCYLVSDSEWPTGALNLPWGVKEQYFVGKFARDQGARVPTKLVQSAKSWLCHSAAERKEKILPFEAGEGMLHISPIEASARYLQHLREAWNEKQAKGDLEKDFEQQEIVVTVPASFDEIARMLTLEAVKLAGYGQVTLLEEPQAAFYSWISQHEKSWQEELFPGAIILVCDVGGGTTDFSLIELVESQGKLGFQRMAVGDHLLLGGDNMDIALAHLIETKLNRELTPFQWLQVKHQAREAKEVLLNGEDIYRLVIQNSGSHIIQNTLTTELTKEEVFTLLMEGFWKKETWERALQLKKASGFRSLGLPYEEEPSIIKHLAHFLECSVHPTKGITPPDFILFNGGSLKPLCFQNAVIAALKEWFPDKKLSVLKSYHFDLAVCRGAAYYGKVRRGLGTRIGGGSPRSYYFAIKEKGKEKAFTVLPRGVEEGTSLELDHTFQLLSNTPVAFRLYSSHVRLYDKLGESVEIDPEEMQLLPSIHTVLRFGKGSPDKTLLPVRLGISLTSIGTLELWLKSQKSNHQWTLEFQLRKESGQEASLAPLEGIRKDEIFDTQFLNPAKQILKEFYSGALELPSAKMIELLEMQIGKPKGEWSLSILRGLWEALEAQIPYRKKSLERAARWWNLAGFFLRPGFGFPLDDFRMKELWKVILSDYKNEGSDECLIQSWICYRRIAGGLNKGQQMQLATNLVAKLPSKQIIKNKAELYGYEEKIRALAAMELIDIPLKIKLGQRILERIKEGKASAADYWALGRLGARHLIYGSVAHVIPRDVCTQWVEELLSLPQLNKERSMFLFGQLAKKTELRELNLPGTLLDRVIHAYENENNREKLTSLLLEARHWNLEEQQQAFGEQLPLGLSLENA